MGGTAWYLTSSRPSLVLILVMHTATIIIHDSSFVAIRLIREVPSIVIRVVTVPSTLI